jgi:hypothetical protein
VAIVKAARVADETTIAVIDQTGALISYLASPVEMAGGDGGALPRHDRGTVGDNIIMSPCLGAYARILIPSFLNLSFAGQYFALQYNDDSGKMTGQRRERKERRLSSVGKQCVARTISPRGFR